MLAIVAVLLVLFMESAPICTVGSGASAWRGSPADLAAIEAVHQRTEAEKAGKPYPEGAPDPSPWSGLVVCRDVSSS